MLLKFGNCFLITFKFIRPHRVRLIITCPAFRVFHAQKRVLYGGKWRYGLSERTENNNENNNITRCYFQFTTASGMSGEASPTIYPCYVIFSEYSWVSLYHYAVNLIEWGSTSAVLTLKVYYTRKNEPLDAMLSTTCCNVVLRTVEQCCAARCQQLLLTTIVHSCSRSTTIVQSLLTTINKFVSSSIVDSCSNNIVTTIVLCQHRTTIDQTILINIVNSTSVVEP